MPPAWRASVTSCYASLAFVPSQKPVSWKILAHAPSLGQRGPGKEKESSVMWGLTRKQKAGNPTTQRRELPFADTNFAFQKLSPLCYLRTFVRVLLLPECSFLLCCGQALPPFSWGSPVYLPLYAHLRVHLKLKHCASVIVKRVTCVCLTPL